VPSKEEEEEEEEREEETEERKEKTKKTKTKKKKKTTDQRNTTAQIYFRINHQRLSTAPSRQTSISEVAETRSCALHIVNSTPPHI
jgi:hypothetical protein